ncbi:MAG: hypothetical protein KGN36_20300 [Acidobacteriota bacterium]|nr:hypothetical protein [Acidobacteriota bacterium]
MARPTHTHGSREARLERLARSIDALLEKDELLLRRSREIDGLRRAAAADLHAICGEFVSALNRILAQSAVQLDPPVPAGDYFRDDAPNLIQINVRGRILQIQFQATGELVSTEDFRVPYTLEGTVRAFNQELLDKDLIEEQLIFFTLEKDKQMWRYFDPRTYRSAAFDVEYLIGLLEQLI